MVKGSPWSRHVDTLFITVFDPRSPRLRRRPRLRPHALIARPPTLPPTAPMNDAVREDHRRASFSGYSRDVLIVFWV